MEKIRKLDWGLVGAVIFTIITWWGLVHGVKKLFGV